MTHSLQEIARGLSKAQRAYLTTKAEFRRPLAQAQERWMTMPPRVTHDVLMRLGLADRSGQLSELGLAVRAHLQEQAQESEQLRAGRCVIEQGDTDPIEVALGSLGYLTQGGRLILVEQRHALALADRLAAWGAAYKPETPNA